MQDDSDADLLRLWRSGDRDAYAALVSRHYGMVLAACLRQAAPGEGEDCTQAVFLVLARRPESAARAPVLAAWFLRVTTYVCNNSRRNAQRRRQAEHQAGDETGRQVAAQRQPEALDHLDACLLKLPERQRLAVTLHYLSGRTAQEVAAILQVNRDNAYQLISRGLGTLRGLLAKRGVALSNAALISLCATQAQAATVTAPAAVLASLTTTPSLGVITLAQGAMTTMTITAFTPFAVAGLVCVSGMLTFLVSADTQPGDTAPANTPPTTANGQRNALPAPQVSNMPTPADADPGAIPAVNTRPAPANGERNVLPRPQASNMPTPADAGPDITLAEPEAANVPARAGSTPVDGGIQAAPISFELVDSDLINAVLLLRKLSGQTIVLNPAIDFDALPRLTLKMTDAPLLTALRSISMLTGLTCTVRDNAYYLHLP